MKILLAADGTKFSKKALEMITNLALSDGDEIKIVSVIDMAVSSLINSSSEQMSTTAELENAARERSKKNLLNAENFISEKIPDKTAISSETLIGSPERRIVEKAEEIQADLIIIGSHGYNGWERLLLGSVSDSIVHHSPCSVLVARTSS